MTRPVFDLASRFTGSPRFGVDRSLNVPVGVQLRGQIEYGIACGEIARGARLPSVRELSLEAAVAHATVAQVYKELRGRGLIVARPGQGTFVADDHEGRDLGPLRAMLGEVLTRAKRDGVSPEQVLDLLGVLVARSKEAPNRGLRAVFVGVFEDATRAYSHDLCASLAPQDEVLPVTLDQLRADKGRRALEGADLVLAPANRAHEVRALLPGVGVLPVNLIPAPATRAALAALDPRVKLAVVATFDDFLPTLLAGVRRFAPQLPNVRATHLGAPDLREVLDWAGVTVYASGSQDVLALLPPGGRAFEYRHTVDPADVRRIVRIAGERKSHDPR